MAVWAGRVGLITGQNCSLVFEFCFRIDRIDKYFCHDTVEEIVDALVSSFYL